MDGAPDPPGLLTVDPRTDTHGRGGGRGYVRLGEAESRLENMGSDPVD